MQFAEFEMSGRSMSSESQERGPLTKPKTNRGANHLCSRAGLRFRRIWAFFFLFAALSQVCHAYPKDAQVERVVELGFGFRRVTLALPVVTDFESTGHFAFLYYGDEQICQVGGGYLDCLVAPSGVYVIFAQASSGKIFLYRRTDGRRFQLTNQFTAPVHHFEWHEKAGIVNAYFTTGASDSFLIRVLED